MTCLVCHNLLHIPQESENKETHYEMLIIGHSEGQAVSNFPSEDFFTSTFPDASDHSIWTYLTV